jgi:hypothetical protein
MAKCSRCHQRKAKRRCPALRDGLCPLCCGSLRDRAVACPPSCRFLAEHKSYQDKKTLRKKVEHSSKKSETQDDFFKDERMAWLALHIEAPLRDLAEQNPEFKDGEAILALEYAKDKLARGRSILVVPGEELKSGNATGEAVYRSMDGCRYEPNVILAGAAQSYTAEEKTEALERLILAAKSRVRENFGGRAYLDHILAQFVQINDAARQTRILTAR